MSVRFDDEFIRCVLWRNFYEPYTWQWQEGRSRWDLLDVVRITRALRPEGINWPVTPEIIEEKGFSHGFIITWFATYCSEVEIFERAEAWHVEALGALKSLSTERTNWRTR